MNSSLPRLRLAQPDPDLKLYRYPYRPLGLIREDSA
jgi:hypothetical protein